MGQLTDLHAPPDNVTDKRLQTWRGGPKKEKKEKNPRRHTTSPTQFAHSLLPNPPIRLEKYLSLFPARCRLMISTRLLSTRDMRVSISSPL